MLTTILINFPPLDPPHPQQLLFFRLNYINQSSMSSSSATSSGEASPPPGFLEIKNESGGSGQSTFSETLLIVIVIVLAVATAMAAFYGIYRCDRWRREQKEMANNNNNNTEADGVSPSPNLDEVGKKEQALSNCTSLVLALLEVYSGLMYCFRECLR
jgi:hypothetical protein